MVLKRNPQIERYVARGEDRSCYLISDEATAAVAGAFGQHAGELALGASQTIGQYLLPNFVAAFRRTNPKVRITARSGNTDQVLEALLARDIHLALIEGPEQRRDFLPRKQWR